MLPSTHAAIALAASLLAAGCLGSDAPTGSEDATAPIASPTAPGDLALASEASPPTVPATRIVANWTGFMKVGAAYEAPSHVDETNAATREVWSPSFQYEVLHAPQDLEVRLNWTAAAGQLQSWFSCPPTAR